MTDLTTRLAELINAATNRPERPHTAHGNHQFYYDCAICSGNAEEIAAALAPGIQNLITEAALVTGRDRAVETLVELLRDANRRDVAALDRQGWPGIPEITTGSLRAHSAALIDALLASGVLRELPTREQVMEALGAPDGAQADVVLALLNGSES